MIVHGNYYIYKSDIKGVSYGSTYLRLYNKEDAVLQTYILSVIPSSEEDISRCNIVTFNATYSGNELKNVVFIQNLEGATLIEGEDYTVEYLDNINAGTGTAIISGINSYNGSIRKTFTINPKNISYVNTNIDSSNKIYAGKKQTTNIELADGEKELVEGIDYIVDYKNNINIGKATVTISGIGNYTGAITKTFEIVKDIANLEINIKDATYIFYKRREAKPELQIKDNDYLLTEGKDYTVIYKNNIDIGIAIATITGIKNYGGTIDKNFKILPIKISSTILQWNNYQVYSNKTITPWVQIWYYEPIFNTSGALLTEGKDYTITYKNNINVGTAKIIITGIGAFEGSIEREFYIHSQDINSVIDNVNISNTTYTGKYIKTSIKLTNNGYTLEEGRDYIVSYKNNKNIGTATVTITGKGNFIGSIIKTFTIIPKKVTLSSVKNVKTKAAKITWKKDTKVSGYEVYMATSKNGKYTKIKTVKSNKTVNYTKKKLKKNKKYYFMVRSYKTVNGKKIYGAYSSKKYVKVKK